jgi:hypothetical protein
MCHVSYAVRGWCGVIQNKATPDGFPLNRCVETNFALRVQTVIVATTQFNPRFVGRFLQFPQLSGRRNRPDFWWR